MKWYSHVLANYTSFSGRARCEEYRSAQVIDFLISCAFIGAALASEICFFWGALVIYRLAVFLPMLAVLIRRLHDTERHWMFVFVSCIPWAGWLLMLVLLCQKGTRGYNAYGPDALSTSAPE